MGVKLKSSSGGSVTLQEPTTASDYTITVPAASGKMLALSSDGTSGQVLTSTGANSAPTWQTPSGGVTSITAGTGISVSASTGAVTVSATGTAPSTSQVLSATAGASEGAVGTYALASSSAAATWGTTRAGSSCYWVNTNNGNAGQLSGTWKMLSWGGGTTDWGYASVWLRIA